MKSLKPTKIYTFGDYYKDGLQNFCHMIKHTVEYDDIISILFAETFADQIPDNTVFIPIPDNMQSFSWQIIRRLKEKNKSFRLASVLCKNGFEHLYDLKKRLDRPVELTDVDLFRTSDPLDAENIVIVDDVIGTGAIIAKAIQLIGKPCQAMCVAVDWNTFNSYNWYE